MPDFCCFFHRESSFIKFHITGNFDMSVGCIPELVSLGSRFITNEDHFSALWLEFRSPLFKNVHPGLTNKDSKVGNVRLVARPEFSWSFIVSSSYQCDVVCVKLSLHSIYPKTVG